MRKQSIFSVAATVVISTGMASAQTQTPQQFEKTGAGVQSTKRDKLPVATLLDAGAFLTGGTDQAANFEDRWSAAPRAPYLPNAIAPEPQTSGQGPNGSKAPDEN
jgi:hypothetical protein